jgi:HEAT repeat protein
MLVGSGDLRTTTAQPLPADPVPALQGESCSLDGLLAQIRRGLHSRSEAYRRYLRNLLQESAVHLSATELRAAFAREKDPALVEHLAAALAARTERGIDETALQAAAGRALGDPDPAVRAATLRGLRRTSATVSTGDLYQRLVRDPSPEVRQEAATNLIEDNQHVYSGHSGPAADSAVAAAAATSDVRLTSRILGSLSTEAVSPGSVDTLKRLLHSDEPDVRRAAALALGGVPAAEMGRARDELVAVYRDEQDAAVGKALLQSIARLGFAGSVPELQKLRSLHPALRAEVEAWIRVLGLGLQEWSLILREKQRLQPPG